MNDRPEFNKDTIGEGYFYAVADETGAKFPIICPGCGKSLTEVKLNEWSVVDIKVECMGCGAFAEGHNLRAQTMGKFRQ